MIIYWISYQAYFQNNAQTKRDIATIVPKLKDGVYTYSSSDERGSDTADEQHYHLVDVTIHVDEYPRRTNIPLDKFPQGKQSILFVNTVTQNMDVYSAIIRKIRNELCAVNIPNLIAVCFVGHDILQHSQCKTLELLFNMGTRQVNESARKEYIDDLLKHGSNILEKEAPKKKRR